MAPRIQNKRSSLENNPPNAGDLLAGEIAINTNATTANIHFEDATGVVRTLGADPVAPGTYQRVVYGDGSAPEWVEGGASVSVGDEPPASPSNGDLWWNSDDESGRLYVYYEEDGGSSQWVEASPQGGGGGGGGGGTGTGVGADAWACTGANGTVSASFNINPAVTTDGNGSYEYTFITPMPSDNYAVTATIRMNGGMRTVMCLTQSTTGFTIITRDAADDLADMAHSVVIHATNVQLPDTVTVDELLFVDSRNASAGTQEFQNGLETTGGRVVLRSTESNKALWVRPADQAIAGFDTTTDAAVLLTSSNCTLDANRNYSGFGVSQGFADGFTVPNDSSLRAFDANLNNDPDHEVYNFYASGSAPNYFRGMTYFSRIGDQDDPSASKIIGGDGYWDIIRRVGNESSGCLGLSRAAFSTGTFINFKSASASDSSFGASDAVIRLAGYGNVVTVGITNTFSLSRASAAPAGITDAAATVKALAPGVTGFAAQDLIDNAPSAVIENDAEKDEILVDQTKLIPILTKALQEVMAKNEDLEARLAALEGA